MKQEVGSIIAGTIIAFLVDVFAVNWWYVPLCWSITSVAYYFIKRVYHRKQFLKELDLQLKAYMEQDKK